MAATRKLTTGAVVPGDTWVDLVDAEVDGVWLNTINRLTSTTGTSTAYTATATPPFLAGTLVFGTVVVFIPHVTCGATPMLTINGIGPYEIVKPDGSSNGANLVAGDLIIDNPYVLEFRSTYFMLLFAMGAAGIVDASITTAKIADGAVTTPKLATGAVTTAQLGAGAVDATKLALGAVATDRIADSAVTATKIAVNAIATTHIMDDQVTGGKIAPSTIPFGRLANMADTLIVGRQAGAGTGSPQALTPTLVKDILGLSTIDATDLADGAITTPKLADGAVTEIKLATGAVTSTKLAAGAVTSAAIADLGIATGDLADASVTELKIANGAVTANKIGTDAVTQAKIASDAVGTAEILDANITEAKIQNSAVTANKIGSLAVTNAKIDTLAVTNTKIADLAVSSDKLQDGAVITIKINDAAVSEPKLQNSAVTANKLATDAVTQVKIADAAVSTAKIVDAAVTEDKLQNAAVTSNKIGSFAVTTNKIDALAVTNDKIADTAISSDKIADGQVITIKIDDAAVTEDKLRNSAVTSNKIGTFAVTTNKIEPLAVTAVKILDISASHVGAALGDGRGVVVQTGIDSFEHHPIGNYDDGIIDAATGDVRYAPFALSAEALTIPAGFPGRTPDVGGTVGTSNRYAATAIGQSYLVAPLALSAGVRIMQDDRGGELRLTGSQIVYTRARHPVYPGQSFEARWRYIRRVDTIDPSGDAVQPIIVCLNAAYAEISRFEYHGVAPNINLEAANGLQTFTRTISSATGTGIDAVWPAGTVHLVAGFKTFGPDGQTALQEMGLRCVTDLLDYSPEVASFDARLVALEATDLTGVDARLDSVEEQIGDVGYALYPSGGDDTAALVAALSTKRAVYLPNNGAPYTVTGTIPVYGQLIGIGHPIINLTINNADQKGFWGKSGGGIRGVHINRIVNTVTPSSGAFGCAITTGEYSGSEECTHFNVRDVSITGSRVSGGAVWNTIAIMGNTHDGEWTNITIDGEYLIPVMLHWGFDKQATAEVQVTYHPRRLVFDGLYCLNKSDSVDAGGLLTIDCFGFYSSGGHDLTLRNHVARGGTSGVVIAPGDFGDERAHADSKGRMLTNIHLSALAFENVAGEAIFIAGGATKVSYLDKRWLGINSNMSVTVDGMTVLRGNNASSTNPGGYVQLEFVRNVHIRGLVSEKLVASSALLDNDALVRVVACTDCSIEGTTLSGSGWLVESGADILLKPTARCSHTAAPSNYDGVEIFGGVANATVKAAVVLGATSITLDVTANIFPGMLFQYGGYLFRFDEGFKFDTEVGHESYNLNAVLAIRPAPIAIPNTSVVELLTGGYRIAVQDGRIEGFHTNLVMTSTDARMPRDVRVQNISFRRAQLSDIEIENGVGGWARNCSFESGNLTDGNTGANINMIGGSGFRTEGNIFNRDFPPLNPYCIYRQAAVGPGGMDVHNEFYQINEAKASKGAIRLGAETDPVHIVANNYFDPGISVRILATTIATRSNIGGQDFISDTVALVAGTVEDGTVRFDSDAAASTAMIETVTTAGTFGTLAGVTGTVNIATNARLLTVNTATGLARGKLITIVGVTGTKRVVQVIGTSVTLDSDCNASVTSAAVAYAVPVIKVTATNAA